MTSALLRQTGFAASEIESGHSRGKRVDATGRCVDTLSEDWRWDEPKNMPYIHHALHQIQKEKEDRLKGENKRVCVHPTL